MSFFASDAFLEALASARHPLRRASPAVVEIGSARFRLLKVGRGRFVTRVPFLDYHTPLERGSQAATDKLSYLERAEHAVVPASDWEIAKQERPWKVAPFTDWSSFPDWESVERHVHSNRRRLLRDTDRSRRRLEQDAGRVEVVLQGDPDELIDCCFAWKAEQFRESGLPSPFADTRNTALFRELARREELAVSALMAGGRPAAVHLGAVHEGRFLYWVPAYDRRLSRYAPGRLLLHHLLEHSFASGHRTFEFLIGDEPYKFHYASHARLIAPVGRPTRLHEAYNEAYAKAASLTRQVPALHRVARAVKHRDPGEL